MAQQNSELGCKRRSVISYAMKGKILVAAVMAGALTVAGPARADDPRAVGSPCSGNELNNTATTSDGTAVRCLANEENGFDWIADTGAAGTIAQLQSQRSRRREN